MDESSVSVLRNEITSKTIERDEAESKYQRALENTEAVK